MDAQRQKRLYGIQRRFLLRSCLVCSLFLLGTGPLSGHGTKYEILATGVIGIKASFETGQPMAGAKVLIFAPGEAEVALETKTDPQGIVCFAPHRRGTWILQVREPSGHGMRINLQVDDSLESAGPQGAGSSRRSPLQKLVMAAAVIWGLLGTALFFRRRLKEKG